MGSELLASFAPEVLILLPKLKTICEPATTLKLIKSYFNLALYIKSFRLCVIDISLIITYIYANDGREKHHTERM
jgi:hypothetical protein